MIHQAFRAFLTGSILLLAGCGPSDSHNSDLEGHYESADAENMRIFAGGQMAVPEFMPVRGVIIAWPLLNSYRKEQMAADIINAGVDTLWVTVPQNFSGTLESASFAPLRRALGDKIARVKLVKQDVPGSVSVWSRDWSPLGARGADGRLRFLDFNYYPERPADDATARSLLRILPVSRVSVPVYNEGGNFMNNNRGVCMMTSRVTDANAVRHFTQDAIMGADEIKAYYNQYAGCRETIIFPRMPYEGTGHIDMWAKFLSDDTLIVGEIRNEIIELGGYTAAEAEKVKTMQSFLNRRASEIAKRGYKVVRIPMPAPVYDGDSWMFRSYTNSLTVNKVALVPRYTNPYYTNLAEGGGYLDRSLIAGYENEVISIYRRLGYSFKWVDSDDVIAAGGAVHCTTMQIPR